MTLSAATLEDLAKVSPTAVTVEVDALLEDVLEKHDSTARAVRQVVDDITEALEEGDALRKEMRSFYETLDQASQLAWVKWLDLLGKATKWDASTRTVRKQRREHTTIMTTCQAAAAKAKRELDRELGIAHTTASGGCPGSVDPVRS